ncbi:glucosaminidase domain-containing protein [Cupriavidus gilardii]|uniref:glucosaminidase domain-containing protein n=1 Tax=Cupriavidus gilardii TaxID=82541 RepID=UPI002B2D69AA|nr:glucosaminidase domain-containing protein [Cupriavidus gilardii]
MDNVKRFAQQYAPLAAQVGSRIGVAPDVLLGQWGLETGWGKSVIPGTNNLGNIKDFSGRGVRAVDNMTGSNDAYRQYATPQAFGEDFAALLSRRYGNALGSGGDATKFAEALKARGYAEDPAYVSKVAGATNLVRKFADMALSAVSGAANAAEPTGRLSDKVKKAREAGYSDDEIFQHLSQSKSFAQKLEQARAAGYSDADIRQHFGLGGTQPKATPIEPTAKPQPKEEGGALTNLGRGLWQGIKTDLIGGPAQLLTEGYSSLVNAIAPDTEYAKNVRRKADNLSRLIREDEAQYQEDTDGSIAAGVGRVGGNIAGALAAGGGGLVRGAASGGQRVAQALGAGQRAQAVGRGVGTAAGSATLGGAAGALAPVTQEGDFGQNKLAQIAMGAGIGAALPGAGAAVGSGARYVSRSARSLVDPFTEAGQNRIAGNILQRFSDGGPVNANASELVPGSVPTLAQVTGNPGLATLERGIRGANPQAANAFYERAAANAEARNAALQRATGTAADISAAEAARNAQEAQRLQAAFENAQPANPQATVAAIDEILKGPSGKRDSVLSVLTNIRSKLVTGTPRSETVSSPVLDASGNPVWQRTQEVGIKYETDPQVLYNSVRKQIGDLLDSRMASSNPAGLQASRELLAIRDALDQDIAAAAPGFREYLQEYAEASKPINAMQFLQGLKLTDAQGNITLEKVQNAIANITKQRAAKGSNDAKAVSAEQLEILRNLRDDLLRAANSGAGKSIVSNTFQNLATNNILENALPGPVRALTGGTSGPVGSLVGKVGNWVYGGANEAIQNRLLEMLMQPQSGLAALQNVGGNQLTGPLGGNALLQRLAPNLLPAGTVGINVLARPGIE